MKRRPVFVLAPPALLGVLLLMSVGCHTTPPGESNRGPVSGRVTLDGTPLPGGSIAFLLASDPRYRISCAIKSDGQFAVENAPLGKDQVTVETVGYNCMHTKTPFEIPAKYGKPETSGLTVEVGPASRDVTIELHAR